MVFKIAIDAGHGNHTAGKRTPDGAMREFWFNNPVAQMVGKFLRERYVGVSVLHPYDTTGAKDTPLINRTNTANQWGADAFVSVHANAFGGGGWNTAGGIETFIYTNPSSMSRVFASNVNDQLVKWSGLVNRGVKTANFAVVRDTRCPSILVECGFMSNKEEAALLMSAAYRAKCAEAIAAGIAITFRLTKKAGAPSNAVAMTNTDKEVEKMADLFVTGSAAADEATINVLKAWESAGDKGISDVWRKRLLRGELTTAQALGLLFVAVDRGIMK